MARITYGSIITDITGSIGGTTFQSNAASKIGRSRFTRRKVNSSKQNTQINVFQPVNAPFQNLDSLSKALWSNFAAAHTKTDKWGAVKSLTGFNWFSSINNYLTIIGESVLSAPPVWESPLAVPDFTPVAQDGDWSVNWSPSFDHSDHYLLIFSTPLLRSLSVNNRKNLRLTLVVEPDDTSAIDFQSEWESTHGISIPISGLPSKKFLLFGVMSVHSSKGLASVLNTQIVEYEPS